MAKEQNNFIKTITEDQRKKGKKKECRLYDIIIMLQGHHPAYLENAMIVACLCDGTLHTKNTVGWCPARTRTHATR